MTLLELLTDLADGDTTIVNGVIAQLTRTSYVDPYLLEVNFQQFVPIVYFNIFDKNLSISNTSTLSFTQDDIFVEDDWICLNQVAVA